MSQLREGLLLGSLKEHRRRLRELATKADGAYTKAPASYYCAILARVHRMAASLYDGELRALEAGPQIDAERAVLGSAVTEEHVTMFSLACHSPESRLEILRKWCRGCGGPAPCNCERDE